MVIFIVFAQGINVEEEHNLEEAFKKASKLYEEGNLRESLNIYAKILEQQPNSPIANNNVAFILTKFGKYAEALHFFSSCLKEDPKNISYFQGYINSVRYSVCIVPLWHLLFVGVCLIGKTLKIYYHFL